MELKFLEKPVQTIKEPMEKGEALPEFTVLDAKGNSFTNVDFKGKPALILTVPDVNSRACSLEAKKFNRKSDKYENVDFYTISKNTVEEQSEWCAAKGVESMHLLSDADNDFGMASGTYVKDIDALARMIFAIDENGEIVYRQVVEEIGSQPDFNEALDVVENLNK
ncbi:MAG: peroxiredoxin [Apilactobacillus sp.]|uniref:peroxiredoxin n=1 Tax=Apilactobacillus TaxID=2767877 RepID=UPI0025FC2D9B|nr:peroxiredoxin [Apilactobacillus sp.]MCT6822760.1 peroxiredoxin [Apilactobacillus sp.]MCT6857824.1 peroxiredoxin [Apilactobacillus sp.]